MTITSLKTVSVAGSKTWNYVRLETDAGVTGTGEAHPGAGICDLIERRLAPMLIGADARNVEPLHRRMLASSTGDSAGGMLVGAIGGVETALWDVAGKALGVPAYRLLGGAYRDRIRLYADVGRGVAMANTPASWAARAREAAAEGFDALKFDIDHSADELSHDLLARGLSLAELERMTALVAAAREGAGDRVDLAIDCHGIYQVRDVLLLAERLTPFRLMFLEDPVPPENVTALAKVTRSTPIPICTGEWRYRCDGFRELIEQQACDLLHVDVAATGGMSEAKRIADLADLYYMPFAAHNITSPLGLVASAHVCAAVRNLNSMELPYHCDQVAWRWDLVRSPEPLIDRGRFVVPRGPGLGVELDETVVNAHLAPGSAP
ncbi:MAG: mandelate racemase/muconate lactonizing enzyme family protein, partial [Spirochaetaceae bacterium]|nr:mandelate racemase/muconate lactonizing enzyme family protein [Spirochaetaceae bacterium]